MDLRSQYAFTNNNFVGTSVHSRLTPVVVDKAADGQPVLKPCQKDTFVPENPHTAIAYRPSAEADWQPVRSISQLQEVVKNTPAGQLGEQLGIWTDTKRFGIVGARDGVPQNSEVQPFSQRWQGMQTLLTRPLVDLGFRTENRADAEVLPFQVGREALQVSIDPSSLQIESGSFPGKEVGFLGETGKVSQHDIYISNGVGQGHQVVSNGGETPLLEGTTESIFVAQKLPVYVMPKVFGSDESGEFKNFKQTERQREWTPLLFYPPF